MPILTILLGILVLTALLLVKKRAHKKLALMGLVVLGALFFALRPVCYPLTDADVTGFSPPIEERHETNFYGLKVFQQRDGEWHYCKAAIKYWFFG